MSLDPQIASLVTKLDAGFPRVETMTGSEARAAIKSRFVPSNQPEHVTRVTDHSVAGPDVPIPVRIYRPQGAAEDLPIVVYAHGGGFVFCDLDTHDALCRSIANLIPAVVISVDYRLAPEHRWPAAAEDVFAVTQWAASNGPTIGADTRRVVVAGDSAGGNLAAVTAIMARDRGGPDIAAQMLIYPVLAADFETRSYKRFGTGFYNPEPALRWYWDQYVPDLTDRQHPYACPPQADLTGVAPAIFVIAGHDPARDEALNYVDSLSASHVTTVRRYYEGAIHGFMTMPMLAIAQRARVDVCQSLSQLLARTRWPIGT